MFKTSNEFCIHLDRLKDEHQFDTYIETISWFAENESDQEMDQIAKHLNRKIRDAVEYEARQLHMLKDNDELVSLF